MVEQEEKYIKLLLERCMNLKNSKILFVSYDIANEEFVKKLAKHAENIGVDEVYLDKHDIFETKKVLEETNKDEVSKHPLFNASIWDEYAKKGAAFLMISSEFPGVLDNIDITLIAESRKALMKSKPIYKKMQKDNELVWLIAVYPNNIWAKDRFPDLDEEEAFKKLFDLIMEVTLCKEDDPIQKWNEELNKRAEMIKKLNDLRIKSLHFTNEKGTDLTVYLSNLAVWQCAGEDDNKIIVNMPSYEVFTSPDCRKTEGIVYSTKPLSYNSSIIDNFWVKFEKGKVVDFDAEEGKDLLEEIIKGDEGASMLGEVALVDKNSPIAKTNFVFDETCLDENASCHIALGSAFLECIDKANTMNKDELKEIGLNESENHVDFMIGTDDLTIEAETNKGRILIFKDGVFCLED